MIDTTQARLTDAVIEGEMTQEYDLVNGGEEVPFAEVVVDLSGTELYSDGDLSITLSQASVSFNPTLDLDLDISGGDVERLRLEANGTMTTAVAVQVAASTDIPSLEDEVVVWSDSRTYVTMIGWMPVVTVAYLELSAGYSLEIGGEVSFEAGLEGELTVGGGFDYEDGITTPIANFQNPPPTPIGPSIDAEAAVTARMWLEPKITLEFYDIGGPYLAAQAGVTAEFPLDDPLCGWTVTGAFDVLTGAEVDVLDLQLEIDVPPLLQYSEPLLDPTSWPDWETYCCERDFVISLPGQSGPASCTTVTGNVTISSPVLTNVDMMQNVQVITGDLVFASNTLLDDLGGLAALTTVGHDLTIGSNAALTVCNFGPRIAAERGGRSGRRDRASLPDDLPVAARAAERGRVPAHRERRPQRCLLAGEPRPPDPGNGGDGAAVRSAQPVVPRPGLPDPRPELPRRRLDGLARGAGSGVGADRGRLPAKGYALDSSDPKM